MKKEPRNRKVYERSIEAPGPKRPQPPDASAQEVWDRVRALVAEEPREKTATEEPAKRKRGEDRRRRRLRRWVRTFDVVAVFVWTFVFVKLFIADVDRFIVGAVAPEFAWLLDYRIVFAMLLTSMVLLLFKARTIAAAIAYVAAYPLVVLLWKVPYFVVKRCGFGRKGMTAVVVILSTISAWMARAKWILLALAILSTSVLVILLSHSPIAIYAAAAAMIATLGWSLAVRAIDMLRASRFIEFQRRVIAWVLNKKFVDSLLVPKHPDKVALKEWDLADAKAYRDAAGNAVLVHRILGLWAYAIEQYRRGPVMVVLNIAAVILMLLQVIFVFSFVNAGIYIADPAQFHTSGVPEWWTWVYYSGSSLTFGEIGAVTPVGAISTVAKILNGGIGGIGILTIVVTFIISFRTAKTDYAAEGSVKMLNKKVRTIEELSVLEYKSGVDELEAHLADAAWGLHVVSGWLFKRVPAEWRLER